MSAIASQVENIPGFGVASTAYEYFAPDYLKTKDPFYVKEAGEEKRRRAPPQASEAQRKDWKRVMKKAWQYDRNFCCGNCVGFDLGLGIIPIINILPVIGPIISYTLQASLIRVCGEAGAPLSVQAKMTANCGTDFLISLCPLLGVLCCWLFGCATRNAAIFDTWLSKSSERGPLAPGPHTRGVPKQFSLFGGSRDDPEDEPVGEPAQHAQHAQQTQQTQQTQTQQRDLLGLEPERSGRPRSGFSPYGRPLSEVTKSRTSVAQYALAAQPGGPAGPVGPVPGRPAPVDL